MTESQDPQENSNLRDPALARMLHVVDELTSLPIGAPPRLDEARPVTSEPSRRRGARWTTAPAAALVTAGIGALIMSSTGGVDPSTSSPTAKASVQPAITGPTSSTSEQPAPTGPTSSTSEPPEGSGRSGPVIYLDQSGPVYPTPAISYVEGEGELRVKNNCTWIQSADAMTLIVWRSGTRWDAEYRTVVLPNGTRIRVGTETTIEIGAPTSLQSVLRVFPELTETLSTCMDSNSADSVAIVRRGGGVIEPPPTRPPSTTGR